MTVILNPIYTLKPDKGRALIIPTFSPRDYLYSPSISNTYVIHPIYAIILSFMDGRSIEECVMDAADKLKVPTNYIQKLVDGWFENPEPIRLKSKEDISMFPPYMLIQNSKFDSKKYDYRDFLYEDLDTVMKRHYTPSALTLMLNNTCYTKCVYCYQDKRKSVSCSVPFERISQIINEAADLHVVNFDVIGGEFFLYPYWKELLSDLRKHGFQPYISTKIPIQEEDVRFLSEVGIMDLQLSIDSLIQNHLRVSLNVKEDYPTKIKETLNLLEKYKIPTIIHSVLTSHTDSIDDMKSIYEELCKHSNIIEWKVVKGEETLYPQVDFKEIEISNDKLNAISEFLTQLQPTSFFNISCPEMRHDEILKKPKEEATELRRFLGKNRSFCSGLFSHLYILPDGNVTMCEQLYWNPNFIVGNIINQSIEQIWNSSKTLGLYHIRQEDIPSDSLCSTCGHFKVCRETRQVCYREIIKKYGRDKWYYPDVNCPLAKKREIIEKEISEM